MSNDESDKTDVESVDGEKCPICIGNIKNKRFLQCCHGFCCDCLELHYQKNSKNNVIECPVCRDCSTKPGAAASGDMGEEFMEQSRNKLGCTGGNGANKMDRLSEKLENYQIVDGEKHCITTEVGNLPAASSSASGGQSEQSESKRSRRKHENTGVAAKKYENTNVHREMEAEKFLHHKNGTQQRRGSNLSMNKGPKKSTNIQVSVRLIGDSTISLTVSPGESVNTLKTRICEKTRISTDRTFLVHEGQQLQDGCLLSYYNIREDSNIQQVARLVGGGNC